MPTQILRFPSIFKSLSQILHKKSQNGKENAFLFIIFFPLVGRSLHTLNTPHFVTITLEAVEKGEGPEVFFA